MPLNRVGDLLLASYSSPSPPLSTASSALVKTGIPGNPCASYGVTVVDEDQTGTSGVEEFRLKPWQPDRLAVATAASGGTQNPVRGLALPGTSLVELWFRSVCGTWAAFDSPTNPLRRLCATLWSSNEAVFFALQTMAAASLPRRPPNIREIVMLAPQMSTQALIRELQELFNESDIVVTGVNSGGPGNTTTTTTTMPFPAGLLTSLFCMSSSLSWIDARQLGIQYLRNARSVIELLDMKEAHLSADDRELLEFFRGCLLYEETLRSLVTDDQEDIQALLDWKPPAVAPDMDGDHATNGGSDSSSSGGLDLHPWVGVPIVLIGLFGKVMALCRRSRKAWRQTAARATYQGLYQAMLDIQEGKQLEERLLTINVQQLVQRAKEGTAARGGKAAWKGNAKDDADTRAVETHLYTAAEAFRLSSLLQLYQTFPDLTSQQDQHQQLPATDKACSACSSPAATSEWLMLLVLHIINLLAEIPPSSPMRCLQPLLCLCAGSALRQDTFLVGSGSNTLAADASRNPGDPILFCGTHGVCTGPRAVGDVATSSLPDPATVRQPTVLELARSTIRERLALLEQNLPPRPIVVARQLLEKVWETYDKEVAPSRSHWLDIMAETNFESVFG